MASYLSDASVSSALGKEGGSGLCHWWANSLMRMLPRLPQLFYPRPLHFLQQMHGFLSFVFCVLELNQIEVNVFLFDIGGMWINTSVGETVE